MAILTPKGRESMMMKLINDLWMKNRSLVNDGYDEALSYIGNIIDLKIHEIPGGTECWTWIVPEKWVINEAYIMCGERKIVDFKEHPLHVISYSLPVDKEVSKEELLKHLHWREDRPNAIPFEFKYYERDWGFCIQHSRLKELTEDKYKVFIDSKFEKGTLKVGDFTIEGEADETIGLVAHLCHPAQVNDDLAGVAVLVDMAKEMGKGRHHYTYKFLLVPETIGSVAYLSQNEDIIPSLKYGIFIEMPGNDNIHALQLTRQGNTRLDRLARYVMKRNLSDFREGAFRQVVGNDEMVFNGPGVNVPMISISRYPYPEYHTSDDNPSIITEERLEETKELVLKIIDILDRDYVPQRTFKGPIFLSRYGLWIDWRVDPELNNNLELIMLSLEGDESIFDIAEKLDMDFDVVYDYINKFLDKGLVVKKSQC
ncbi:MAG: DUF4910 domain-containing protein [Dehalococcoidia bacterium]|nr:MAG: DUF4910 domain-containing protein [Dehalococcoidia bacterium]